MTSGRRKGDVVGYQRGSGSVEVELANLQSEVERIAPALREVAERVDDLESYRDNVKGILKMIAVFQVLIFGLIVAFFSWALNHTSFHSDYEQHSGVQSPQTSDSR